MKELEYPFDNGFIMSGAAEKEGGCAGRLDY